MNTSVTVRGSLFAKPISVRALVANLSEYTTISSRLAEQLGITQTQSLLVADVYDDQPVNQVRTISLHPIVVESASVDHPMVCYPVIDDHAFYEMIVGKDLWSNQGAGLMTSAFQEPRHLNATLGPAHQPNMSYLNHNTRPLLMKEVDPTIDRFVEIQGTSTRTAINHVTREVVSNLRGDIRSFTQVTDFEAPDTWGEGVVVDTFPPTCWVEVESAICPSRCRITFRFTS